MKRRWAILFWCSLSTLIGLSWMIAQYGATLWSEMNAGLVGQIVACAVAFFAMQRATPGKWPAAVASLCVAPMTLELLGLGDYLRVLVECYGISAILMIGGTLATAVTTFWILLSPLAAPPAPPPVAPARVVD
jgi:hypothetical protein